MKYGVKIINKINDMEQKVLEIINEIRIAKGLKALSDLNPFDNLRDQVGFTSFDLAELTVKIEDEFDIDIFEEGLVNTVGEVLNRLK